MANGKIVPRKNLLKRQVRELARKFLALKIEDEDLGTLELYYPDLYSFKSEADFDGLFEKTEGKPQPSFIDSVGSRAGMQCLGMK